MAKESNKLDAKTVKNLAADPNQDKKYSDGGGLYLLVKKNGAKYWRLNYRHPVSKKQNTLALGTYEQLSLQQARIKREEAKMVLANGIDPAEQRNNKKREQVETLENTFSKFAAEWLELRKLENKVDSETIRKLNKDILPFIGKLPVAVLTTEQLERDVTNALVERGALESARRVKSIINMVLKLPLKRRIITYNPAPDITLPQPIKGNHNAITSENELAELLQKLWRISKDYPRTRIRTELAIKLSAYIYQRPNEIRGLKWESVDFENRCLSFAASKTNQDHIVPLSRQAFDILKELEEMRTTSEYVFPSVKTSKECMSDGTLIQLLKRIGFNGRHTAHGFRATARTLLDEEIEYRTDIVEHQLAHRVRDPNGTAYNRTKFLRRRREMMQLWADYLDTLRQGGDVSQFKPNNDSENLIQFKQNTKMA
ncbi:tyrosine-type recombinase/integrase [Acinetobacter baumannii]|uniref:tyrosine-type recombinase/integrase n=1 Tax=Acinetobacter baumannii TaxID=470 RepID=UPI001FB1C4F6|nr:integrase arm-type DNA-binding domain-containing protein [Acinetobacter baumannii]UOE72469.1 integrase arm-type DNA-binding domain-containing protein [Acinetobacter baumannii]